MPQITSSNPLAFALAAHEFAIPCIRQTSACSGTAVWALRSTHGAHCPEDGFVCNVCKAYLEASWASALGDGVRCANCHMLVAGQVSDHLRFIAL